MSRIVTTKMTYLMEAFAYMISNYIDSFYEAKCFLSQLSISLATSSGASYGVQ
jgi:hypothetical protein